MNLPYVNEERGDVGGAFMYGPVYEVLPNPLVDPDPDSDFDDVATALAGDTGDECFEASSIFDIVGALIGFIDVFVSGRVMKDCNHMRFDGDGAGVTALDGVLEDITDAAVAFAGKSVVGVVFLVVPSGILDVDVDGMITDGGPEIPRILFGPGLG